MLFNYNYLKFQKTNCWNESGLILCPKGIKQQKTEVNKLLTHGYRLEIEA